MSKKKVLLVTLSCVGLVVVLLTYINTIEYSVSEISPDNYMSKLTRTKSTIFEAGLQDFIPDNFPILESYRALTSDNYNNNGLKITNNKTDDTNQVDIHSYRTNINYTLVFKDEHLIYAWIFKQGYMDPNTPPTRSVKKMIDDLILQKGFMLMRTNMKVGSDFIIKETDDSFIIGSFTSYDNIQKPVEDIGFSTYSKKVFPIW